MALGMALFLAVKNCDIAVARPVANFDYRRLFEESDLVVIASVLKTEDTEDQFTGHEDEFKGQNTEFKIQKVIQGNVDGEKLELLHFKYVGRLPPNGPRLVEFEVELETDNFRMAQAEYMLFLKQTRDGRYVPVSSQYDSSDSVKILSPTIVNRHKEKQEQKKK